MGEVTMERHGNVALVTISSPDVRNALTPTMAHQLSEHCRTINDDESFGAMVLRGDGGTFCSGADTRGWAERTDPADTAAYADSTAMYDSFLQVGQVGVPTVAAVRGAAVGAGLNLALATDLRIVANGALIRSGFMRAGIHPGGGFFTLASRLGGREAAAALGIFGQDIPGERAAALSVAWEAVPDDDVETRAMQVAQSAATDPELVRQMIATFRAELGPPSVPWSVAVEMERGVQMWSKRRRSIRLDAAHATSQPTNQANAKTVTA